MVNSKLMTFKTSLNDFPIDCKALPGRSFVGTFEITKVESDVDFIYTTVPKTPVNLDNNNKSRLRHSRNPKRLLQKRSSDFAEIDILMHTLRDPSPFNTTL